MSQSSGHQADLYDGPGLKEMLVSATAWLERNAATLNALNVFPVPDGDTGTNMLLTMRATLDACSEPADSAGVVASMAAHGALMGARGNSGVILSQILRGLAKALESHDSFGGVDFAAALEEGSATAYKGIGQPTEGTMLTVIREAAAAARAAATTQPDLPSVLRATLEAARTAVANTPNLLPVLKEAGVVDAGGQGLLVMFEGMFNRINGSGEAPRLEEPQKVAASPVGPPQADSAHPEEEAYGYCTEFIIQGQGLDLTRIRDHMDTLGKSTIVVGDESTIRVHVHTFDPGAALSYATALGTLRQVKVQDMDEQHQEYLALRASLAQQAPPVATVAVVSGPGLGRLFESLGAVVVPGGQTMNPSAQELAEAAEAMSSPTVVFLPNNKNVILAANQADKLSTKDTRVVPSRTVPQGVAALLAFNAEAPLEENLTAMEEALSTVKTAEITTAVRSTSYHGLQVKEGEVIGLVEGELVASGTEATSLIGTLLDKMDADQGEVITIYYGDEVGQAPAEVVAQAVRERYPNQEIELVDGGQPHYQYIVSVE